MIFRHILRIRRRNMFLKHMMCSDEKTYHLYYSFPLNVNRHVNKKEEINPLIDAVISVPNNVSKCDKTGRNSKPKLKRNKGSHGSHSLSSCSGSSLKLRENGSYITEKGGEKNTLNMLSGRRQNLTKWMEERTRTRSPNICTIHEEVNENEGKISFKCCDLNADLKLMSSILK